MTNRQNDGKIGKESYNIKIIWTVDRWTDEQINLKIYRHNNVAAQVGQPPPPLGWVGGKDPKLMKKIGK